MVASYLLMAAALLLVMWRGLLPGLLCVCLGFLLTRALTGWFAQGLRRLQRHNAPTAPSLRAAQIAAAALVMLLPLALLAACPLDTLASPRDGTRSRMLSSA